MDEPKITTLAATGSVASRFVSADELEEAKRVKEEQWRAAYARLGQEPPPKMEEEEYDPRTLYEKLHQQKEAKREQWDEKMKMSNQWRGLEADELQFLAEVDDEAKQKEREKEAADKAELRAFKAKQARENELLSPALEMTTPNAKLELASGSRQAGSGRSNLKAKLKGVVVKKKKEPAEAQSARAAATSVTAATNSQSAPTPNAVPIAKPIVVMSVTPVEDPNKRKRVLGGGAGLAGIASGSDTSDDDDEAQGPEKKKSKA